MIQNKEGKSYSSEPFDCAPTTLSWECKSCGESCSFFYSLQSSVFCGKIHWYICFRGFQGTIYKRVSLTLKEYTYEFLGFLLLWKQHTYAFFFWDVIMCEKIQKNTKKIQKNTLKIHPRHSISNNKNTRTHVKTQRKACPLLHLSPRLLRSSYLSPRLLRSSLKQTRPLHGKKTPKTRRARQNWEQTLNLNQTQQKIPKWSKNGKPS